MDATTLLLCSMKWKFNHVPILLAASMLALGGLVYFQYQWIAHSRKLSDEIFHQQVSMAVCKTIEKCEATMSCSPTGCKVICTSASGSDTSIVPASQPVEPSPSAASPSMSPEDLTGNDEFQNQLKSSLDFYNIDIPFHISESQSAPYTSTNVSTCVVNIPPKDDRAESFISLVFPSKNTYMVDKLKYMIASLLFDPPFHCLGAIAG
jgi:hypothetical protein